MILFKNDYIFKLYIYLHIFLFKLLMMTIHDLTLIIYLVSYYYHP